MHYRHGYQENDLKAMFHISIPTVRKVLRLSNLGSHQRDREVEELGIITDTQK